MRTINRSSIIRIWWLVQYDALTTNGAIEMDLWLILHKANLLYFFFAPRLSPRPATVLRSPLNVRTFVSVHLSRGRSAPAILAMLGDDDLGILAQGSFGHFHLLEGSGCVVLSFGPVHMRVVLASPSWTVDVMVSLLVRTPGESDSHRSPARSPGERAGVCGTGSTARASNSARVPHP